MVGHRPPAERGPGPATVELCQRRAWFRRTPGPGPSSASRGVGLLVVQRGAPRQAMASVRFTTRPSDDVWKVLSRMSSARAAIRSRARSTSSPPTPCRAGRGRAPLQSPRAVHHLDGRRALLHKCAFADGMTRSPSMLTTWPPCGWTRPGRSPLHRKGTRSSYWWRHGSWWRNRRTALRRRHGADRHRAVVKPAMNWRRDGPSGSPGAPSARVPASPCLHRSSWPPPCGVIDRFLPEGPGHDSWPNTRPSNVATNSVTSAVMTRMPARFSQKPAFIICGSRTNPVPNTIAFGGVPTGIM